jgi:hypothetical protein
MFAKPPVSIQRQPSILMKAVAVKGPTIVEKEMLPSTRVTTDEVLVVSRFSIGDEDGGFYHLSSQVAVSNNATRSANLAFYQIGVCLDDMSNSVQNVKSIVCNSVIQASYSIVDGLNTVLELEGGKSYVLWLNLSATGTLEYASECSHLRLYKL